jgi:FkbM family methyltransferase
MNKLIDRVWFYLFRKRVHYSQCGEDIIIKHLFNFLKIDKIRYLDIGTNHPKITNNTFLFYSNGSSGVCVEPNSVLCNKIRSVRPNDICLNVGMGLDDSIELVFYKMSIDTLSTFSEADAKKLVERGIATIIAQENVKMLTYDAIINQYFQDGIDFVSIDVEDLNEEIVKSITFNIRPKVFCVETISYDQNGRGKKIISIIDKFQRNNYFIYADTFINTIFVDANLFNKAGVL